MWGVAWGVVLDPSFAKTEDEITNQDENSIHRKKNEKKERIKLVFSSKLVLPGVSSPVMDLLYLH
jgi:hypothetical protein